MVRFSLKPGGASLPWLQWEASLQGRSVHDLLSEGTLVPRLLAREGLVSLQTHLGARDIMRGQHLVHAQGQEQGRPLAMPAYSKGPPCRPLSLSPGGDQVRMTWPGGQPG